MLAQRPWEDVPLGWFLGWLFSTLRFFSPLCLSVSERTETGHTSLLFIFSCHNIARWLCRRDSVILPFSTGGGARSGDALREKRPKPRMSNINSVFISKAGEKSLSWANAATEAWLQIHFKEVCNYMQPVLRHKGYMKTLKTAPPTFYKLNCCTSDRLLYTYACLWWSIIFLLYKCPFRLRF